MLTVQELSSSEPAFFELLRLRIKRFFCENWEKRETKTLKFHNDLQRFYQRVHQYVVSKEKWL